ncbi:methyl-accepting chemotaxis protein [Anaerobacillus arseniciselenatis]|uniref:Methyl-accepting chemotaxis protein n=1 Tax=Anaerobacillus arseniciselenatis TaxID=85682 RepID=A0A1S2LIX9_9BACI|nr:methyl-accepting chemotaxis protein [Anaerobacillus arseniciselenatis]OIJ11647.1 methyl-accepting chemotaxis protein [Anaerobacillus arseniciselenatis]
MFSRLKLATKINLLVLSFIILLAVVMSAVVLKQVESAAEQAAMEKVRTDLPLGYEYIDAKYPGDWSTKGGDLYKGEEKISDNFDLVDEIAALTNGTVTIFLADTRVATNVIVDGQRAVGTQVSEEIANAVLVGGQTYYGVADVVGNTYQTGYMPILDASGETIGIWYVGASQSFIDETIQETMTIFLIILIVAIIVIISTLIWYSRRMSKRLRKVSEVMTAAGNGDFTKEIKKDSEDEIGQLVHSFEEMKNNLNKLINGVINTSNDVASSSNILTHNSEQTSKATEQIANAIQEVTFGTEKQMENTNSVAAIAGEISVGMNQITTNIQSVTDASVEMSNSATQGNEVVKQAVQQMNLINTKTEDSSKVVGHLSSKTNEINQIISLITEVADQTNLLALNAAIEAARAGEQGKGFAVVADEVRKLAEQSGKSAQQISSLIIEIQEEATKAVDSMNDSSGAVKEGITIIHDAGEAFGTITSSVNGVSSQLEEVAAGVEEVTAGVEDMVSMTTKVKEITEQSAEYMQNVAASTEEQTASMQEVAASAVKLTNISEELRQSVKVFKV